MRGYRLPMRRPGDRARSGRVLLAGDAAGLVDPLSGDGMYEAFVSARLGRRARARRRPRRLRAGARAGAGRSFAASWKAKHALERRRGLIFGVARLPFVWGFVSGVLRGDFAPRARLAGWCARRCASIETLGR